MLVILRTFFVLFVGLAGFGVSSEANAQASSIRVVVNGDIITSYDIAQRARILPLFGNKGGEKGATEDLIDEMLKLQEGRKRGVNVPEKRVDAAYASLAGDKKISEKQLTQELGRLGIDADSMKRWIKVQMTWRELLQVRVRSEGQVKTADVMAAMLEKGSPEAMTMTEYTIQQIIFVVPEGSPANYVGQRRREAENFRGRFAGCDNSLAQAKELKGVVVREMGRRDASQLRGAQGEEIKKTQLGETTRPAQTDSGIELFAVCATREIQSNAAVRTEVETKLRFDQAKELGEDYLKKLRDAAIIQRR
jgi:peptidyl-prolyl cis-trans isomerase SurA